MPLVTEASALETTRIRTIPIPIVAPYCLNYPFSMTTQQTSLLLAAATAIHFAASAKAAELSKPSEARLGEIRALSEKVSKQEIHCKEWEDGKDNVALREILVKEEAHKLTPPETETALTLLEKFPGLKPESAKLAALFTSASHSSGFPSDYRWNWSQTVEFPHCAPISWFLIVKALATTPSPNPRFASATLSQARALLTHAGSLTHFNVGFAAVKLASEKAFIKLPKSDQAQLKSLEAEIEDYKKLRASRDTSKETRLGAQCKDDPKDKGQVMQKMICPKDVEIELTGLYGSQFAEEMKQARLFSDRLLKVLEHAQSVKK